jgi:hypothetical protein
MFRREEKELIAIITIAIALIFVVNLLNNSSKQLINPSTNLNESKAITTNQSKDLNSNIIVPSCH